MQYISYYTKSNTSTIGVWKRHGTAHKIYGRLGGALNNSAKRKWAVIIEEKMHPE
jgi:hypothetical protein